MLVRRSAARLAWRCLLRRAQHDDAHVVRSRLDDVIVPHVTLHERVWRDLDQWRHNTAIECGITGRGFTYGELHASAARLAAALRGEGLQNGDVVCLALANAPEFPVALLGALQAGLVVSTLNPSSTPTEMRAQLVDSTPRCVVCSELNQKAVSEALQLSGLQALLIVAPALNEPDKLQNGAVLLRTLLGAAGTDDVTAATAARRPEQVAVIPYSSGTTGLPKGVCLSHGNLVGNVQQLRATPAFRRMRVPSASRPTEFEVVPAVLPFYHIYGLTSVMTCCLCAGAKLVTLPGFTQPTFERMLAEHEASMLFLVPPLVLWMAQAAEIEARHMRGVWLVASGAAPLAGSDVARFMSKAPEGMHFVQGYGLTETSPCVFSLTPGSDKFASVGGPMPNVTAKVIDGEGRALPSGAVGEVCVKGPQNMLGYHNNPEATAEMIDAEGWLHTGDLGYYDDDHDFYIVDRLKELIKVKGLQVAPAELEALLRSHPLVEDAAVVGQSDARSGEVPVAFVVAKPDNTEDLATLEQTLKDFVATQLSPHKHLAAVRFVETVPKSPAGKILRKELRKQLTQQEEQKPRS